MIKLAIKIFIPVSHPSKLQALLLMVDSEEHMGKEIKRYTPYVYYDRPEDDSCLGTTNSTLEKY